EAALRAAEEVAFLGPMALLKEPPRPGAAEGEQDRLAHEVDAGFTGLAMAVEGAPSSRAAKAAATVSALELGLELLPAPGAPEAALKLIRALRSKGARPSAVRLTGFEEEAQQLEGG